MTPQCSRQRLVVTNPHVHQATRRAESGAPIATDTARARALEPKDRGIVEAGLESASSVLIIRCTMHPVCCGGGDDARYKHRKPSLIMSRAVP
jgi:hypothetical protein